MRCWRSRPLTVAPRSHYGPCRLRGCQGNTSAASVTVAWGSTAAPTVRRAVISSLRCRQSRETEMRREGESSCFCRRRLTRRRCAPCSNAAAGRGGLASSASHCRLRRNCRHGRRSSGLSFCHMRPCCRRRESMPSPSPKSGHRSRWRWLLGLPPNRFRGRYCSVQPFFLSFNKYSCFESFALVFYSV